MSDALVAASAADAPAGPLEAQYLGSCLYRDARYSRITSTHWHIAWANGLGWGFDGMDGAIRALVAPLLMQDFAINLGTYRSGVQIASLISIIGLYRWPWLAARVSAGAASWRSTSPCFAFLRAGVLAEARATGAIAAAGIAPRD